MSQIDWVPRIGSRYGLGAALVLLGVAVLAVGWRPLLATDGFMPHGVCYTWRPGLVRLHVASDVLIGLAYFSIPVALVYFKRKRRDLPFGWMFLLFGLFIVACGATHWMEVWTLWRPQYWLAGAVKAVTAAASVPTAIALAVLIPRALAIPSTRQLREAKDALESEVLERRRAETALREARATLEQKVEERTAALAEAREQAEAANRLKDEFLAAVSHELRSPLNSVMGWLHVLENAPPGAADARQAIDKIRRNVDTQARLIGDLLNERRVPAQGPLPSVRLDEVRVLVVDDEAEAREVLRGALSLFGAQVRTVDGIEPAIDVLRAWQPHVLVSDLGLTGEDGCSLIRKVRALNPASGGRTPAVALTALARPEDRLRALAAGFQLHVAKPVEPRELALVIASVIGRLPDGIATGRSGAQE
jgi:CheY-like chemotaxis protein